jgi:quercetin dioxygenase-like cupin family protein
MQFPAWIRSLPSVSAKITGADGKLLAGTQGQVVFWHFTDGGRVPPHHHGAQMGIVLSGNLALTIDGHDQELGPGDHFVIEAGQVHSAIVGAGSSIIECFEEPDRHTPMGDLT